LGHGSLFSLPVPYAGIDRIRFKGSLLLRRRLSGSHRLPQGLLQVYCSLQMKVKQLHFILKKSLTTEYTENSEKNYRVGKKKLIIQMLNVL